jgi:hypothetical protein
VHHDRVNARLLQVDDVLREGVGERGIAHGVAAELDDDGLVVVADEVGQRLGEDARLHMRRGLGLGRRAGLLRLRDRLHGPGLAVPL